MFNSENKDQKILMGIIPYLRLKLRLFLMVAVVTIIGSVFPVTLFAQTNAGMLSKERFKNPVNSSKPLTWWHWINGNVTREGIKKDLIDMKRVGIGGVQLFDTHMYLPKGPIRYGSDAWFIHVHYAMQVCDSLGLEFYMTNSPGWSGAGGPWITLEKSMKQLVYSETKANHSKSTQLAVPFTKSGFYKDIAIIAVSAAGGREEELSAETVSLRNATTHSELKKLVDHNLQTSISFEKNGSDSMVIEFKFKSVGNMNSLNISLSDIANKIDFKGAISISNDGVKFKQAAVFNFADHQAPTGNFTIPFEAEKIKFLRLSIDHPKRSFSINEIGFKNLYGLKDWKSRTGMSKSPFITADVLTNDKRSALKPDEIIEVTRFVDAKTGLLKWTPPAGDWTILRFGYTTTGKIIHPAVEEGTGYEVDKLDPEAVAFQFNHALGRIIKDAGKLLGRTFKGVLYDSFEGGFQNWTANLPEYFADKNNYKLIPYLPVLTGRMIESKARTSAVLWDFQQTLTTLFAENYYGTMQKLANQHQLKIFSESQGGPMSPAHANAYVDVPMNEFWTDGIQLREKLIKQTVSIANILGKNIVAAEAFTSKPEFGKWQSTPESMKTIGDYAFTTGINRFIFHTYTHQPYDVVPGFTMGRYGTDFGRTNTWWKYGTGWMSYITRSQYLLQQGHIVADVCFLSSNDAIYEYPAKAPILPKGYNFDIIYPAYLKKIEVVDGELRLQTGPAYKIMVLPDYPFMELETLLRLQKLLRSGAIISGAPPLASPKGADRTKKQQFDELVKEIWGDLDGKSVLVKHYGKGKVYWGKPIELIMADLRLKLDVKIISDGRDPVRYIHKKSKDADIYLISNQGDNGLDLTASFRNQGKQPEIWDAETGKTWKATVFDTIGNRVNIPLHFGPKAALFVVFNKALPEKWIVKAATNADFAASLNSDENLYRLDANASVDLAYSDGSSQHKTLVKSKADQILRGPWTLNFLDGRNAPADYKMNQLSLWQNIDKPAIRYYSGTVSYQNRFNMDTIDTGAAVMLELGALYDLAEVRINQRSAGIIWKKPYQLDISSFLKKGDNEIEILVANRWINRLIGDEFIHTDLRYDLSNNKFTTGKLIELPLWLGNPKVKRTDHRFTFSTWKHYSTEDPLVNSGLSGPVKLTFFKQFHLEL